MEIGEGAHFVGISSYLLNLIAPKPNNFSELFMHPCYSLMILGRSIDYTGIAA